MISIHKRTLLWLLGGLLAISGLAGIATYKSMLEEVNEMQDFELRHMAHAFASASEVIPSNMKAEEQHLPADTEFIVQIWDLASSRLQYSSHPSVHLPLAGKQGLSVVSNDSENWRVFNLVSGNRTIQAAQSMEDREATAFEMVMRMLVPFLMLIPMLAGLAWIAVRQGMAPLGKVVEDIETRDAGTMEPLNLEGVPEEIRPLVEALNELLRRLEKALNIQRQFVADAAHELRTPLTALSLQAQLVQQLQDEPITRNAAVRDLRDGIHRTSHLVQQLLDLARQEPGTTHAFSPLDLTELAREKVGELSLLAEEKSIDLAVEAESAYRIAGDRASLKLLIGNLLDNAIRYTPKGGRVTVGIKRAGDQVVLSVEDNGQGIEPQDRDRIFERFYRPAGQASPGSGLGLAIVSEVASLHHATLQCLKPASGTGSIFTVSFLPAPVAPADETAPA